MSSWLRTLRAGLGVALLMTGCHATGAKLSPASSGAVVERARPLCSRAGLGHFKRLGRRMPTLTSPGADCEADVAPLTSAAIHAQLRPAAAIDWTQALTAK